MQHPTGTVDTVDDVKLGCHVHNERLSSDHQGFLGYRYPRTLTEASDGYPRKVHVLISQTIYVLPVFPVAYGTNTTSIHPRTLVSLGQTT
jgi:hypothetical protein